MRGTYTPRCQPRSIIAVPNIHRWRLVWSARSTTKTVRPQNQEEKKRGKRFKDSHYFTAPRRSGTLGVKSNEEMKGTCCAAKNYEKERKEREKRSIFIANPDVFANTEQKFKARRSISGL